MKYKFGIVLIKTVTKRLKMYSLREILQNEHSDQISRVWANGQIISLSLAKVSLPEGLKLDSPVCRCSFSHVDPICLSGCIKP